MNVVAEIPAYRADALCLLEPLQARIGWLTGSRPRRRAAHHWEIERGIWLKHVPPYEVWAFGSCAKWTAKKYPELDGATSGASFRHIMARDRVLLIHGVQTQAQPVG